MTVRFWCLLVATITCSLFTSVSLADTASQDPWQGVAVEVCQAIDKSIKEYESGDIKKAHLDSVMAYFKVYDTKMEPAVRVTLGGGHVFSVEREFRNLTKLMTPNPSKEQLTKVKNLGTKLCDTMHADAKVLTDKNISLDVYKVNQ